MSVADKVVVVTGAARGMGRAYAQGFLERGAKVAALDLSWTPTGFSGDRDDAFARELQQRDNALPLTCDITDVEQIQSAFDATIAKFGTVDVLINNASLRQIDLFPPTGAVLTLDTKDSDFARMFDVSVFGTLKLTRAFIRPMLDKRSGSVIAVSSGGGIPRPDPEGGTMSLAGTSREQPYQSAKAAVTALFGYLATEVRPYNVAVNVINPASAKTTGFEERAVARAAIAGTDTARPDGGNRTRPARPEHVVPIALFLAEQDATTGVSGKIFNVMQWNQANGFGGSEAWAADA
jgi:NAD(P)-dependent dehydrogenase (short-subunit alcohol dehydrogenase family)